VKTPAETCASESFFSPVNLSEYMAAIGRKDGQIGGETAAKEHKTDPLPILWRVSARRLGGLGKPSLRLQEERGVGIEFSPPGARKRTQVEAPGAKFGDRNNWAIWVVLSTNAFHEKALLGSIGLLAWLVFRKSEPHTPFGS
jgi:hypothetical protein